MSNSIYWIVFKKNNKEFTLGLNNTKNRINDAMLASAYLLCSESTAKFAKKNGLVIETLAPASKGIFEIKDISEYFYSDNSFNEDRLNRHLSWLIRNGKIPKFRIRIRTFPPKEELIGRCEIIRQIEEKIKNNNKYISLQAPRAMGKTSILHVLSEKGEINGYIPFFVELRNIRSCKAFIGAIAYAIKVDNCEEERERKRCEVEKKTEDKLFETADQMFEHNKNYLILIDEFADFLRNLKESDELNIFLDLFKKLFYRKNIIFISSSSDSEDRIIGKDNDIVNQFEKIVLPPLKHEDGKILIEELFYNIGVHPGKDDIEETGALIGEHVPYLIHAFIATWEDLSIENITPKKVYEKFLGFTGWNLLREFQEFPKRYPGDKTRAANILLSELTKKNQQKEYLKNLKEIKSLSGEDFEDLLERLQDDLLIKVEGPIISFRLKIFKDFWIRYPVR